jgi:hypothetical protein
MRKKRSDAYEKHFSRACCNSAGSLGCTIARHSNGGIDRTVEAIDGAIGVYRLVLEGEPEAWLLGRPAQPVFRGCETPAPRATKRPPIVPADLSEADSDICRPRGSRTPGLEARSSAGSALPRLELQPRFQDRPSFAKTPELHARPTAHAAALQESSRKQRNPPRRLFDAPQL